MNTAEDFVEHATHLDIVGLGSIIVTFNKVTASVTLTELGWRREGLDANLDRKNRLEKDVL